MRSLPSFCAGGAGAPRSRCCRPPRPSRTRTPRASGVTARRRAAASAPRAERTRAPTTRPARRRASRCGAPGPASAARRTSIGGTAPGMPAQHRAHARNQLVQVEGLEHVVVGAGVEAGDAVAHARRARRRSAPAPCCPRAQRVQHSHAVLARQAQIENRQVVLAQRRERARRRARPAPSPPRSLRRPARRTRPCRSWRRLRSGECASGCHCEGMTRSARAPTAPAAVTLHVRLRTRAIYRSRSSPSSPAREPSPKGPRPRRRGRRRR